MASLTQYFNRVSKEENQYVAASFYKTPSMKRTTKRPLGRLRKRPLDADTNKENILVTRAETIQEQEQVDDKEDAHVDGEERTAKHVRRQYSVKQKQCLVVSARHHGVQLTEAKFGIPAKKFQKCLNVFHDSDLGQISVANRSPKKQRVWRDRQKASPKLSFPDGDRWQGAGVVTMSVAKSLSSVDFYAS